MLRLCLGLGYFYHLNQMLIELVKFYAIVKLTMLEEKNKVKDLFLLISRVRNIKKASIQKNFIAKLICLGFSTIQQCMMNYKKIMRYKKKLKIRHTFS